MSAPDSATNWRRVRVAFEKACELEPDERAVFLAQLGGEDQAVRSRVDQLLAADRSSDEFLEPPQAEVPSAGLEGMDIGGFHVLSVLAEGGMGTVYVAEQEHPRRRVALKTMRQGLTSPQSRRRFQYEGELLARLRHPNIAQVLGAGVLELEGQPGLPWLALELVEDARALTALGRDPSSSLERRLRLFLTTCNAVHHAHLRGVIHRDLKGANVLVDGEGHIKVIDFGIARPLSHDAPTVTRSGEVVGTLASMAPEQLGSGSGEVDARADVYALGVLLYELVVGRPPHDLKDLSLAEAARVVEAVDPASPSSVNRSLPRELDWIVGRALAKSSDARYASVSELSADVGRLLDDQPVQAGPPSTVYRLKKYYRRHRLAVVAAVGAFAALVAGLIGTSIGLVQARDAAALAQIAEQEAKQSAQDARTAEAQARTAEQEARTEALLSGQLFEFFQDGLSSPDPAKRGRDLTMLDFLRRTAGSVDARFPDQPLVAGLLHRTIGRSLHGLGENSEATEHLERSIVLLDGIEASDQVRQARRELAAAYGDLAIAQLTDGHLDAAEDSLVNAEETLRSAGVLDELQEARIAAKRGRILVDSGQLQEAEELLRAAITVLPAGDDEAIGAASTLGGVLHRAGRRAEAIEIYRDALESWQGTNDLRLSMYLRNNLGAALQQTGQSEEALVVLKELLPEQEALFGPTHPDVIGTQNNLAALYFLQGRPVEALPLWNASLAALEQSVPDEHLLLQTLRVNVGVAEIDHGDPARGEQLLRGVWTLRKKQLGPNDERTLKVQYELARALERLARHEEALELAEDGAYRILTELGETNPTLTLCEYLIGTSLHAIDRKEDSLAVLEALLDDVQSGRRNGTHLPLADVKNRIRLLSGDG